MVLPFQRLPVTGWAEIAIDSGHFDRCEQTTTDSPRLGDSCRDELHRSRPIQSTKKVKPAITAASASTPFASSCRVGSVCKGSIDNA
ncbi:hypothetical protein CEE69_06485 [Rhodopirellula bahusiensis]|uniref:Uncharacterized protein n=1 Tax=Rhodopirellula bahusiensis TaxID=2014065 RepID=A0A2G1WCC1_9BACT|nr:hypothetical protein CEE69_06485 [Rhodopirellula bahusiensis]